MADKALDGQTIRATLQQFDADAFRDGLPFSLLGECGDELTQARAEAAMRDRAKALGISMKEFDSMLKAAKADLRRAKADEQKRIDEANRSDAMEQAMNDGGKITGLAELMEDGTVPNFGEYICTDRAVMTIGAYGQLIKVCGHPLFPTRRYVNIETGSELLDISYKLDGRWKTLKLIDRKTVSQARTITGLSEYGLDITSENAKDVVMFIAEMDRLNRDHIRRQETVNHLGWIDGRGFAPYIDGVEYDHGGKFAEAYDAIKASGSFDIWKEKAGEVMADPSCLPARLLMAASVASVLLRWTSQQPFIVHLWSSESGTGKTVATMLAASIWADPELGRYVRSMNATKVANEQLAGFCNHMPLILDELQTVQHNADFDELIYMLCEGTGKARGAKDGGLRDQTRWMNTIITNGEQPISAESRAGAVNRVISIEADGEIIPGDMPLFADTLRKNHGHAGRMLIERILKEPEFSEKIRQTYISAKNAFMRGGATGKQANYGAALLVGDIMLCSVIFGMQFKPLTIDQVCPYLATSEMVDTNIKLKDWLVGFVASNAARFRRETDGDEIKGAVYGKIEKNGDVLVLKSILTEQFSTRGRVPAAFMRWCEKKGYLYTNHSPNNRHWEVWATIPGIENSSPVYWFRAAMFANPDQSGTVVDIDLPFT